MQPSGATCHPQTIYAETGRYIVRSDVRQTYAHVDRRKKRRGPWRIVLLISSFHQELFIIEALGAVEHGWSKSCMRVCYSVNESDLLGCMAGSSLRAARQQIVMRGTKNKRRETQRALRLRALKGYLASSF
jgi:hypothetical protein